MLYEYPQHVHNTRKPSMEAISSSIFSSGPAVITDLFYPQDGKNVPVLVLSYELAQRIQGASDTQKEILRSRADWEKILREIESEYDICVRKIHGLKVTIERLRENNVKEGRPREEETSRMKEIQSNVAETYEKKLLLDEKKESYERQQKVLMAKLENGLKDVGNIVEKAFNTSKFVLQDERPPEDLDNRLDDRPVDSEIYYLDRKEHMTVKNPKVVHPSTTACHQI